MVILSHYLPVAPAIFGDASQICPSVMRLPFVLDFKSLGILCFLALFKDNIVKSFLLLNYMTKLFKNQTSLLISYKIF